MSIKTDLDNSASDLSALNKYLSEQHLNAWHNTSLSADTLLLNLPDACIDEFDRALARTGDAEIPDTSDREHFKHCVAFSEELLQRLDSNALGAVIVDRIPSERYHELDNRRVCGMFSSFVGPLMAQNFAGLTLYDVKNTNPKNPEKVRKSITNHAQPYHTDGGWHRVPAKYVGLYCVRNAQSGGGSKITSMLSAYKAMLETHPEHLKTLLVSSPWDMQGEHAKDEPGYLMNPMFESYEDQFVTRYYDSYVRNGYRVKGEELPGNLDAALDTMKTVISEQPYIRFEMSGGQFQYLNNWTVLHAREAFADTEQTPEEKTRHVIRVWNN